MISTVLKCRVVSEETSVIAAVRLHGSISQLRTLIMTQVITKTVLMLIMLVGGTKTVGVEISTASHDPSGIPGTFQTVKSLLAKLRYAEHRESAQQREEQAFPLSSQFLRKICVISEASRIDISG